MHSKLKRMMFILLIVILLSGCQVQKTYNLIYVIAEKDYDLLENVPLELHETLTQIDFSQSHSSALTSKNRIFMWGDNQYTQLGDDVLEQSYIPIDITSRFSLRRNEVISKIAVGNGHSAAITSNGRLFMWGANNYGQLGDGTRLQRVIPIDITDHFGFLWGDEVIQVALGTNFSAALTAKGRLFTWGINGKGQCGRGTDVEYYELPVEITSFFNLAQTDHITQISLGVQHAAAVSQHGRVFTWGEGTYGKLGCGDQSIRTSPVDITSNIHLGSMEKVKQVSLGDYHSLAVTSTGRLFGWGALGFGEIGSFSRKIQSLPKNITSLLVLTTDEKVIGASAGTDHNAAITSTGRLLTWGSNSECQLGDGTNNYRGFIVDISSKIRLHQDEIILRIDAAGDHTVALTSDGLAFAWGSNEKGQLGNGTRGPRATPTPVLFNSFVIDKVVKCHENDPIDYSPTKAGFIFDGWYQDTKLLNLYTQSVMPAHHMKLYARWVRES